MPRRVPATALARAWTVLKVIVTETHTKGRVLERPTPINTRSVNGGTRRIDRRSWSERLVRDVDDDVVIVRIREHHRREARQMSGHRSGSRRMYATIVTA